MTCRNVCRLCENLFISEAVTFTAPNLIINIPAGSYANCSKVCLVVAQAIPDETTITAPVFITIGDGTELYPLNRCDGVQVTAAEIRTRTRYATRVVTTVAMLLTILERVPLITVLTPLMSVFMRVIMSPCFSVVKKE